MDDGRVGGLGGSLEDKGRGKLFKLNILIFFVFLFFVFYVL